MNSLRFVILHYHILKNAGSTLEEILEHSFHEKLARIDHPERDGTIPGSDVLALVESNPEITAVTSHSIRYPMPEAPGILFFDICFLRDPLDRVRSMYDYFRKRPAVGDPVSHLANESSLGDFIAGMVERFPLQIRNVQVNLIAAAGDSDEPGDRDLEIATERMMRASFLGVVDRFDESIVAGQYFMSAVFPGLDCALPPVNVSKGLEGSVESRTAQLRDACDPRVFEELLRMVALDFKLVERARAEIRRRLRLVPEYEEKLAALVRRRAGEAERKPARALRPRGAPGAVNAEPSIRKTLRHLPLLMRTPLFDAGYYGGSLWHFIAKGARDGRKPHPLFDTAFYLRRYPDVAASGLNPLAHYLVHGAKANLIPHPLFDPVFYLERNPDVAAAGLNPLAHYVVSGCVEGRKPHPQFQPGYYLAQCPEAGRGNGNPLAHYVENAGGGAPHRLFTEDPLAAPIEVPRKGDLVVDDVPLRVEFVECDPGEPPPGGAVVWLNPSGSMEFRAPPHLRRFLQSLNYGQLRAQIAP